MRPAEWWGCGRKTTYTEKGARKAVKRAADRWDQTYYAYECPHCGEWHLTKRKPAA